MRSKWEGWGGGRGGGGRGGGRKGRGSRNQKQHRNQGMPFSLFSNPPPPPHFQSHSVNKGNKSYIFFNASLRSIWVSGWMDGWMGGWVDVWVFFLL